MTDSPSIPQGEPLRDVRYALAIAEEWKPLGPQDPKGAFLAIASALRRALSGNPVDGTLNPPVSRGAVGQGSPLAQRLRELEQEYYGTPFLTDNKYDWIAARL